MKCIKITGQQQQGNFVVSSMKRTGTEVMQTDDWNTVTQILKVRGARTPRGVYYGDALEWTFPVTFGNTEGTTSFPLTFPIIF